MTKNTSIYIILNFLLLILFIDIYISFNIRNLQKENFSYTEINGENIVSVINGLCKFSNISTNKEVKSKFSHDLLNIIYYIINKNENNLETFFRKVDPFNPFDNENYISTLYNVKINNLKEMITNIRKLESIVTNYKKDADYLDGKSAENRIFKNNRDITKHYGKNESLIETNLNAIKTDKKSCSDINKFLIMFYIKHFRNKTDPDIGSKDNSDIGSKDNSDIESDDDTNNNSINEHKYKISFLSIIQQLTDDHNSITCDTI